MSNSVRELEPKNLWNNFEDLNAVPRPSKGEERVVAFIKKFGQDLGLETYEDPLMNVIIKKPATAGMENRQTIILQSHLDMVHQKNADTDFDFETEGIRTIIDGDWVKADGTTLGADNGLGVATIMSLLESKDIPHPAVEALFTIDEEEGMTGAKGLEGGKLEGTILLNLDTEEDNELCIGCAGGIDTNTYMKYKEKKPNGGAKAFQIKVSGLEGGHSGIEIHLGRANANKLMNRMLFGTTDEYGMRVANMDGGSKRNAIPRECFATIVVQKKKVDAFLAEFESRKNDIITEYKSIEPNISITIKETGKPKRVMGGNAQKKMLRAIYAVPNNVFRMSPDIPGLVETSSSFAIVKIGAGEFTTQSLQRSSIESGKHDIANAVRAAFEAIGAKVENGNEYPGWAPNADSPILKSMEKLYEDVFEEKPHVAACHAGLECGIIGTHYPGLDMISFGPTIRRAHSPDEKTSISSVQKYWKFFLATVASIPEK